MDIPEDVQPILEKVKAGLEARGANTIRNLGRAFRNMDSWDGNRQCDKQEFFTGLTEWGCDISSSEADTLMAWVDKDGSGTVNFDEFLVAIRGELNDTRREMVDKAYAKFDADDTGKINKDDLYPVYSVEFHPKF